MTTVQQDLDKVASILQNNTAQLWKELQEMNPHFKLSEFTRLGFCSMTLNDIHNYLKRNENED